MKRNRKDKILATLGPASSSPKYGHGSIVYGKAENGYNSIQRPGFGLTALIIPLIEGFSIEYAIILTKSLI